MTHPQSRRIWMTLLLDGGQRESLSVDIAHPLIDAVHTALRGGEPILLEIPLKEGTALLTVPSHRLVGVVTEPPIPITLPSVRPQSQSAKPASPVGGVALGETPGVLPIKAAQIQNVLTARQHAELLKMVESRQADFVVSSTSTGAADYRKSSVLSEFEPFGELLRRRVRQLLPQVFKMLEMESFEPSTIEAQLTSHNDGNFYKVHNDNGSQETANRVLTFVYYFNRSPKAYTGGSLRIYDRKIVNGYHTAADTFKTIEPIDNSMVLFLSREMHEVLPVSCPSRSFMDGRFTINGWVQK